MCVNRSETRARQAGRHFRLPLQVLCFCFLQILLVNRNIGRRRFCCTACREVISALALTIFRDFFQCIRSGFNPRILGFRFELTNY